MPATCPGRNEDREGSSLTLKAGASKGRIRAYAAAPLCTARSHTRTKPTAKRRRRETGVNKLRDRIWAGKKRPGHNQSSPKRTARGESVATKRRERFANRVSGLRNRFPVAALAQLAESDPVNVSRDDKRADAAATARVCVQHFRHRHCLSEQL